MRTLYCSLQIKAQGSLLQATITQQHTKQDYINILIKGSSGLKRGFFLNELIEVQCMLVKFFARKAAWLTISHAQKPSLKKWVNKLCNVSNELIRVNKKIIMNINVKNKNN